MYKSERRAKNIQKLRTSSEPTKFAQFLVVSVRKSMVQKYLILDCFDFLERFFCVYLIIPYEIFIVFVKNSMVKNKSVMLPSQCFDGAYHYDVREVRRDVREVCRHLSPCTESDAWFLFPDTHN